MVSLFSENPAYVTIGDDYDKKAPKDPRNEGLRCFLTHTYRLPEPFTGLHEGDPYRDPGQDEKDKMKRAREKMIGSAPFKYSTPAKKSTGLGGYEGCFEENVVHETDFDVVKKGEIPKAHAPRPRNIVTNPTKSGTYGVPGTMLSDAFGGANADWVGQEYIHDPYDNAKKNEQKAREAERALMSEKVPFRTGARDTHKFFDEAKGAGCSLVHKLTKPLPPRKPGSLTVPEPNKENPWKPGHQGKSGLDGLFGMGGDTFAPYREDPYEIKEQREREERAKNMEKFGKWRPVSTKKTLPCPSVEFGGVGFR